MYFYLFLVYVRLFFQPIPCFHFQTGVELELQENAPLLEWFANNYKNYGSTLEIVTDRSQEGAQFVKGFGGIGGKLLHNTILHLFYT